MTRFLTNIFLAIIWAAAVGQFREIDLIVGFAIGYFVLWFSQPVIGRSGYFMKVRQVSYFLLFFLWELLLANLRVAYDVITPKSSMQPGIVAVPLDAETDTEITLLANLITLTPGTLSLDVSDDRKSLYVHGIYISDPDEFVRRIKNGFERLVLELLR
jgi:multicomponent Na+:H+ antiporter subunit E